MTSPVRDVIPRSIVLPCEHTAAVIEIGLEVDPEGVVSARGPAMLARVLAAGSEDVLREYCALWTRYLSRVTE